MKRIIGTLLFAMVATMLPAGAHPSSTYYPAIWKRQLNQTWSFTTTFPGGAFRDRVRNGSSEWNAQYEGMLFSEVGQVADYDSLTCPATFGKNGVHYRSVPEMPGRDSLAVTLTCVFTGTTEIANTNITFDSKNLWHTGTGVPAPGLIDAWSVATHEWGHATGFDGPYENGHFDPYESICTAGSPQTMCPFYVPPTLTDPKQRTLAGHDSHTFKGAYGPAWFRNNGFDATGDYPVTSYGLSGDKFLVGDWNGDGLETQGVFRAPNTWLLDNGSDGVVDIGFNYGSSGDKPVVGDWNGNGIDSPGVVRGNTWYLNNGFDGAHDITAFAWGSASDVPLAGDWNGNGVDTPGLFRGPNLWFLNNGFDGTTEITFAYGTSGDKPIVGDWNGNLVDTPGVRRGSAWYLNNGFDGTADIATFSWGVASDVPLAGDWDGNLVTTPGLVRGN